MSLRVTSAVAVMASVSLFVTPALAAEPPTTTPLITSPTELDVVSGTFVATATSSAPWVKFLLDSPFSPETPVVVEAVGGVATASIPTAGYYGYYHLTARDCSDASTCSDDFTSIRVNIDNPPPTITSPEPNQVFDFWEHATVEATVPSGSVQFYVSAQLPMVVDVTSPFGLDLDVTNWPDGDHRLSAFACDTQGLICEGAQSDLWFTVRGLGLDLSTPDSKFLSPNGDGVLDTVTLEFVTTRLTDLNYEIHNSDDDVVGQGLIGASVPAGDHTALFDGTVDGGPVPDGLYSYVITASNPDHPERVEQVETELVVDRLAPKFETVRQSSSRLYPSPDDYLDHVDFSAESRARAVTGPRELIHGL